MANVSSKPINWYKEPAVQASAYYDKRSRELSVRSASDLAAVTWPILITWSWSHYWTADILDASSQLAVVGNSWRNVDKKYRNVLIYWRICYRRKIMSYWTWAHIKVIYPDRKNTLKGFFKTLFYVLLYIEVNKQPRSQCWPIVNQLWHLYSFW